MAADRFPIEAGHIMMFARAVGDPNPIYHDAEYAAAAEVGGIVAPPTFVAAAMQYDPDTPMRPKIGQPWMGSGRNPTGLTPTTQRTGKGSGLHAEQHYEYHKPLRPGAVLTPRAVEGKTWEKDGRRGGRLVFSESITEYYDEAGDLVLVARGVGVRTERPVDAEE